MRIKRIVTILLVTLLMFSLATFASAAASDDEFFEIAAEVKPAGAPSDDYDIFNHGDVIEYTLKVSVNPGVRNVQILLEYDSANLEFLPQAAYESAVFSKDAGDRLGVVERINTLTNKPVITVTGMVDSNDPLNTVTDNLVTIKFKVIAEDCGKISGPKINQVLAYTDDADMPLYETVVRQCGRFEVHSYGEPTVRESNSCVKGDIYLYECTLCDYVEDYPVNAVGEHSWGEWVTVEEADCTTSGTMERKCTKCDDKETETIDPIGHTAGEAKVENVVVATCTEPGSHDSVVYCTTCEEEMSRETVVDLATGHTPAEAVKENDVAPTCDVNGSYDMVVYCEVCDAELDRDTTVVPMLGHTPATEVTVENVVAPSCTLEGSHDDVIKCTVCGEDVSRETVVDPALGHTEVVDAKVEPTCTEAGKTEGKHCSVCGEILVAQNDIPALGHTWGEWVVTLAPTTTAKGEKEKTCSVCNTTEKAEIAKLPVITASALEWKKGDALLVFTSDAAFADFINVTVNGETLAEGTDYTVAEGSTVVTLTEEYLKSLEKGGYEIAINSTNGSAKITFVKANSNALWIALIIIGAVLVCGVVTAYVVIYLRKKRNNASA